MKPAATPIAKITPVEPEPQPEEGLLLDDLDPADFDSAPVQKKL